MQLRSLLPALFFLAACSTEHDDRRTSGTAAGAAADKVAVPADAERAAQITTKGQVDGILGQALAGWAYDTAQPSVSIVVNAYTDAALTNKIATATANVSRPDVDTAFTITGNHGFALPLPAAYQKAGQILYVAAVGAAGGSTAQINGSPFRVPAVSPIGTIDGLSGGAIQGWAFDPAAVATSLTISAYADPALKTLIGTTLANIARPDVDQAYGITGNHGYNFAIPAAYSVGGQKIYLVAASASGGSNATLTGSPLTLAAAPKGNVDALANGQIVGWAFAPESPATSIAVNVYADAAHTQLIGSTTANGSRPDVDQAYAITGNHGFVFTVPAANLVNMQKYFVQAVGTTGVPSDIGGSPVQLVIAPRATLDALKGTTLSGWAFDPAQPAANVTVNVYADAAFRTLVTTGIANVSRPDVDKAFNITGNHGFQIQIPSTAIQVGNQYYVVAQSATGGPATPASGSPMTLVSLPLQGNVDGMQANLIVGWAYDPLLPAAALTLFVYADAGLTQLVAAGTAGVASPEIDTEAGIAGNHGFAITVPAPYDLVGGTFYVVASSASGDSAQLTGSPVTMTTAPAAAPAPSKDMCAAVVNSSGQWTYDIFSTATEKAVTTNGYSTLADCEAALAISASGVVCGTISTIYGFVSGYQAISLTTGQGLGAQFTDQADCQTATQNASSGAVCTPYLTTYGDLQGYLLYSATTGNPIGVTFATLSDCVTASGAGSSGAVCSGVVSTYSSVVGYEPYSTTSATSLPLSQGGYYNTLATCAEATTAGSSGAVCVAYFQGQTFSGYVPVVSATGDVLGAAYSALADCLGATN